MKVFFITMLVLWFLGLTALVVYQIIFINPKLLGAGRVSGEIMESIRELASNE